jgi:hypothetical protein
VTVIATGIGGQRVAARPIDRERRQAPAYEPADVSGYAPRVAAAKPQLVPVLESGEAAVDSDDRHGQGDGLDDLLDVLELEADRRKDDLEIPAFIRRQMN